MSWPAVLGMGMLILAPVAVLPQIAGSILSVVGLRQTRDASRRGRTLAWIGLIGNGVLLALWLSALVSIAIVAVNVVDAMKSADTWVEAVKQGDTATAATVSVERMDQATLDRAVALMAQYRQAQGTTGIAIPQDWRLSRIIAYGGMGGRNSKGAGYEVGLVDEGGAYRVEYLVLHGDSTLNQNAATQPSTRTTLPE